MYVLIHITVEKHKRTKAGVETTVKKNTSLSWNQINERISAIELEIWGRLLVVIGVYAPNEDAALNIKKLKKLETKKK